MFTYKFVPSVKVTTSSAIASAIVATVSLAAGQKIFTTLTKTIFNYSKVYGSLAAIPIFVLWISILWWIFLVGAALCAVLNKKEEENI